MYSIYRCIRTQFLKTTTPSPLNTMLGDTNIRDYEVHHQNLCFVTWIHDGGNGGNCPPSPMKIRNAAKKAEFY